MNCNCYKYAQTTTRILLGLTMLIPGLLKLFVTGVTGVTGMLTNIGFPLPVVFAWLLIFGEIISGALLIANYKTKYVIYFPIIVMLIATFTVHLGKWNNMLMHLALAAAYWLIGTENK